MEYCSPMGRPIISSRRTQWPRQRRFSFFRCRMGNFLSIYSRHSSPEISWLMSVAQPAPATPICRVTTHTMSRATFSRLENTKNISGVRLSPRERRMPESRL